MADARVLRSMLPDESGIRPLIADRATALGIRPGIGPGKDLPVANDGTVSPVTGGMSVSPRFEDLPSHRIPKRFKTDTRDAEGNNNLICWRVREVDWRDGPIDSDLMLRLDRDDHGLVEPSRVMTLDAFRSALARTVDRWEALSWDELVTK